MPVAEQRAERAAIEDPAVILAAAARLLEARARSVDEVRRRLTTSGYRPELVDAAIERLVEFAILDDEAFARAWIASRDRAHPRGERALRDELRQKGIDPEVIAAALQERAAGSSEGGRAIGLAEPDTGTADGGAPEASAAGDRVAADRLLTRNERNLLRISDPRRRRQRAWALLARNGFDSDTASDATARAERRWSGGEATIDGGQ
jgi:SOS response regulatory protein OraA/RecX